MISAYEALRQTGIVPAAGEKIIPDDKKRMFKIQGERSPSGAYRLKIDGGVFIGWVRDHRAGLTITIKPEKDEKPRYLTPEERARIEEQRVAARHKLIDDQKEAAAKARYIWKRSVAADQHAYSQRKNVSVEAARVSKSGLLTIPVYDPTGAIVNLQFINADGRKVFLKNGRKRDCVGAIPPAKGSGLNTIYITEGWSTGMSVHMATGRGVILCFDAGNMQGAVNYIKNKYPVSKIIIAADNDQWCVKPNGDKWNPGVEAARAVGVDDIRFPGFPPDDPEQRTDWNDWHTSFGLATLTEFLL